jgi:hypothetical protein
MSRKFLLAAFLIVSGMIAYNFVTTGKLSVIPSDSRSPEEQQLASLESRVRSDGNAITGAGRTAGLTGMDTTADVESAMRDLEKVEKEIETLKDKSTSEQIRSRCDRLLAESRRMRGER